MNHTTKFAVPIAPVEQHDSMTEHEIFASKVKLAGVVILLVVLLIARACGSTV